MSTNQGALNEERNIQIIQSFFDSFVSGDVLSAVDRLFAPDAEYISIVSQSQATRDAIPWSGSFRGREEIKQAFVLLGASFEPVEFNPQQYVAQGDLVAVFGRLVFRAVPTGNLVESDWAMNYSLRDGFITRYHFFENTYEIVLAFRKTGYWQIENAAGESTIPR
jgi:ketosteroid isomerase-like protein